jgi:hypothetical protein
MRNQVILSRCGATSNHLDSIDPLAAYLHKPTVRQIYPLFLVDHIPENIPPIMSASPNLAHLLPPSWKTDIDRWYAEDTPSFDWGGLVVGEEEQEAFLWAKSGVSRRAQVEVI